MLSDPSAMTGMMKNNLGMMVPQERARRSLALALALAPD